jgi:hypothetical protein
VLLKFALTKKYPVGGLMRRGLSRVFSARQVVAARNGKRVAETLLWNGKGYFSSQKRKIAMP